MTTWYVLDDQGRIVAREPSMSSADFRAALRTRHTGKPHSVVCWDL